VAVDAPLGAFRDPGYHASIDPTGGLADTDLDPRKDSGLPSS